MSRILVTGGAGFIGSHVVDRLIQGHHSVFVLDNFSTGKIENLEQHRGKEGLYIKHGDVANVQDVVWVFDIFKPEIIIHMAAQAAITTAENNPGLDCTTNVYGTLVMLEHAMKQDVHQFVYASTSAVYGHKLLKMTEDLTNLCPDTYYGVSKYSGELYCRVFDVPTTVLRLGNVYGPRQVPIGENQVIARIMRHLVFGDDFYIFGDGEQKRDFVYVEDVASAFVMAATKQDYSMHKVFNIAGGKSLSVNDIAKNVGVLSGYKDRWKYKRSRTDERKNVKMNIENARLNLGWEPKTDISDGLQKVIAWWKKQ